MRQYEVEDRNSGGDEIALDMSFFCILGVVSSTRNAWHLVLFSR
jgi:hypothetical protein